MAGMIAGRRLQQLGFAPVVLEKGADDGGMGNAAISGGLIHLAWESPDAATAAKRRRLEEETDGEIDPQLADVLAESSSEIIPWLLEEGVEMRPKGDATYSRWTLYPFRTGTGRRLDWEVGPGRAMVRMYSNFRRDGGRLLTSTAASALTRVGDQWRVGYRSPNGDADIETKTVVVADGGFQANREMLSRYVGPNAGLCLLRAARTSTGDGLRLLLSVGAGALGLGRVYGHMLSLGALRSD
jgi:succinate dehydrogenase/fumarate reductase flavoprotein subunit